MAANITPRHHASLLAEAMSIASGLKEHGAALDIRIADEAGMRAEADKLANAEIEAREAKLAWRQAGQAVQRADADAARFLAAARAVLTISHGNRWSAHWTPTGFPDQSTKVPRTHLKRRLLCKALGRYFTDNPAQELVAAKVTAAEAGARHAALSAARFAVAQTTAQLGEKLKARDAQKRKLRKLVGGVKKHLKLWMPGDDPRWYAFGLNAPADPARPDVAGVIALTQSGPGKIDIRWPRARRATRYRVLVQVAGVDAEPIARKTVHDRFTTLDGFIAGQTVRIQIITANKAGEARASAAAEIVME